MNRIENILTIKSRKEILYRIRSMIPDIYFQCIDSPPYLGKVINIIKKKGNSGGGDEVFWSEKNPPNRISHFPPPPGLFLRESTPLDKETCPGSVLLWDLRSCFSRFPSPYPTTPLYLYSLYILDLTISIPQTSLHSNDIYISPHFFLLFFFFITVKKKGLPYFNLLYLATALIRHAPLFCHGSWSPYPNTATS